MSDQKAIEQAYIARLSEAFTSAIMEGDFQRVRALFDSDHEENVRAAASRLVNTGVTGERLAAGRQYIFGLLAEKSNQRLRDTLLDVGKRIDFLAEGLAAVNGSIKELNKASGRAARRSLLLAGAAVFFAFVQIFLAVRSR